MSALGQRVALRRMRRERAAWERVTARMRRRDGTPVYQGEEWRWRELSVGTWWLLIRWRPGRFVAMLRDDFRRWAVMPGDRFMNPNRLGVAEVVRVRRDHVDLLVIFDIGYVTCGGVPSSRIERVDRRLTGWWPT